MPKPPVLLFAFANDTERPLRLAEESKKLKKALQNAHDQGRVEVEFLPNAEIEDVYNAFNRYHGRIALFHYGGHSDKDFIELENGRSDARNLSELMEQEKGLQLVFLNGCANRGQVDILFRKGIKATIATEANIEDDDAVDFAQLFYSALAQGKTINNSYKTACSFLADKQLNEKFLQDSASWRSVSPEHAAPEQGRSIVFREGAQNSPQSLAWGLYHNDAPGALDWRLPERNAWRARLIALGVLSLLIALIFILRGIGGPDTVTAANPPEIPLCPPFTDRATFRAAIFPFDAGNLKPEREIAEMLNKLNAGHRAGHPGKHKFFAEAAVSAKKQENINEASLDSMLSECNAQMVIWGHARESHSGKAYELKLNVRSPREVSIGHEAELAYDDADAFSFPDSLEAQSVFIFSLIDGYFNCFDKKLADEMERRIAREDSGDTVNTARIHIATQYYIRNDKPDAAIALFNRHERLVNASPPLVRNLGLCYVEKNNFRQASETLLRMPEHALTPDFLRFRWRVHQRAGYYKRAIADIDKLLNMGLSEAQRDSLQVKKSAMEKVLQQAQLKKELEELERKMEQEYQGRQWENAIRTADELLKIDGNHLRAAEVSMESYFILLYGRKGTEIYIGKALEFAEKIVRRQPRHLRANIVKMGALARHGRWSEAVPAAQKVLELDGRNYAAYECLIRGNIKLSKNGEACTVLKQSEGKVTGQEYKKLKDDVCGACCMQ